MSKPATFTVSFTATITEGENAKFEGEPQMSLEMNGYWLQINADKVALHLCHVFGDQLASLVHQQFERMQKKSERNN